MKAVSPQVREYRILSFGAVLHSALVLTFFVISRFFSAPFWFSELWVALATLLFFWPIVLALHPGRSTLRFVIPVAIAAGLFSPCARVYASVAKTRIDGIRVARALEKMLASDQRMTLSSLDPDHGDDSPQVLGEAEITGRPEQQALLNALADGVRNNDGSAMLCFNPRHALHIQKGGHIVKLLICFECRQVYPYGFNKDRGFIVSSAPEPVFDAALKRHGLPRSKH